MGDDATVLMSFASLVPYGMGKEKSDWQLRWVGFDAAGYFNRNSTS
jgi:hypothetical protein